MERPIDFHIDSGLIIWIKEFDCSRPQSVCVGGLCQTCYCAKHAHCEYRLPATIRSLVLFSLFNQ